MSSTPVGASTPTPNAVQRQFPSWLILLALTSPGVVMALQLSLPVPLISNFTGILSISVTESSSILTIMILVGAIVTPIMGKLADMYGKRLMILIGLGVSLSGDIVAVFSETYHLIFVSRGLAGFAVAVIPIAISLMRELIPKERLGVSIGFMSVTLGAGSALALPLGGLLSSTFGWSSIFGFSGVFAALAFLLAIVVLRESPIRSGGQFDLLGSALLVIALGALMLTVSMVGTWGIVGPMTITMASISAGAGALWVYAETRAANPVVDLPLSFRRPILLTNLATLLMGVAMFFNMITTTQQAQRPVELDGFGLDAFQAGLVMLPSGLAIIVAAPLGGMLMQRYGGRFALLLGGIVMALSYLLRVVFDNTIPEVIIGSVLVQAGVAIMFGATPALIMDHSPLSETASANGINALVRSIGNALASAIAATLFGAISVSAGAGSYPSELGVDIAFIIGSITAALGVVCALGIRPSRLGIRRRYCEQRR
jgi:predicted MFS family arabinose efflux permease